MKDLKRLSHEEGSCTTMDLKTVMQELEALGKERTKKYTYLTVRTNRFSE